MVHNARLMLVRIACLVIGFALAASALLDIAVQLLRPDFDAAGLFAGARRPAEWAVSAAAISLDGDVRTDVAALRTAHALSGTSSMAERLSANAAAQDSVVAAVSVSPINPMGWLMLGLLQLQVNQSAGAALKTSYLSGQLPPEAAWARLRAMVSSDASGDEDTRLLATGDVRALLSGRAWPDPAVATLFRQANAGGQSFVREAARAVDPRYDGVLSGQVVPARP